MNRRVFGAFAAAAAVVAFATPSIAEPKVGAPAPGFTAVDSNGKTVNLGDFKGKTVVLEWTNDGCPYVRKHYGSGNMQALQKKWTDEGIVWLSVISSPPGEQGFADAARANSLTADRKAAPTAVLLDPKQQVAKSYGALVTPHMYIVDPKGRLVYAGGIDDKPSTSPRDIPNARNHVAAALDELLAGKAVSEASTRPYGCSVKYAD